MIYVLKAIYPLQVSTYNLQIRATDSGVPELMSFALVQVQINDVNDNPPLFSQHNYSAFVHVSINIHNMH